MGTVFARLKVPSLDGQGNIVDHGVHAIVVPLRDASGQCLRGVEIRDCGYKASFPSSSPLVYIALRLPRSQGRWRLSHVLAITPVS